MRLIGGGRIRQDREERDGGIDKTVAEEGEIRRVQKV
jgi:hypothetical protein